MDAQDENVTMPAFITQLRVHSLFVYLLFVKCGQAANENL